MTRLLLINPNISTAMTAAIRTAALARLPAGAELAAVTASFGFPVIASRLSYAVAAHAAVDAYAAHADACDAVILACFGDPGLEALREIAPVPVIGFAEASFHAARDRGRPFAVLTIGRPWIAMIDERVRLAGAGDGYVGTFALDGTGLDAMRDPGAVLRRLEGEVRRATAAGARTVILGGAALAGFAASLPPVADYVDCVQAAMAEAAMARGSSGFEPVPQPGPAAGLSPALQKRAGLRVP
ncbi:aspartate/glutamate racemase family protein [Labrys monachus]|uniref:Asp/Glu/hydantoin racemase n=1 Tax=Labrys monachus TaxID=217067 RepID=A0ABU0FH61_9HYPH|nr:aspartate/glutamate racemase family protein [Labrys monachus]MDQ0393937.1 Asp/Glu/hydantoin racemase [Labrys monachus]